MLYVGKYAPPKVTVIIPTYNRSKYLNELLYSLSDQSYKDFEVIVVDDGSTDDTKVVILGWIENGHFDIKGIQQKNEGAATARNKGLMIARGEIIAFIDDDCLADKDWLKNGVRHFRNNSVVCVEGLIQRENKQPTPTSCVTYTFQKGGFMTASIFYRKSVLKKVGGFDTNFRSFREDTDLGWRVRDLGTIDLFRPARDKFVFDSQAKVTHRVIDYSVWNFFKKHIKLKETFYDVLLCKKHPERFKEAKETFFGLNTHTLWPYSSMGVICGAFLLFHGTSYLLPTVILGYLGAVFFHTRMRSNVGWESTFKHPLKWLGLASIWWLAMLWDVFQRLKAMTIYRVFML